MIITNSPAILLAILSFGVSYLVDFIGSAIFGASPTIDDISFRSFFWSIAAFDLLWRAASDSELKWKRFFASNAGGHILWIPIWILIAWILVPLLFES